MEEDYESSPVSTTTTATTTNNDNTTRYITDSISYIASNMMRDDNTTIIRPYTVVKIINIPWSINANDIKQTFQQNLQIQVPSETDLPQAVHILMDVKTGKTLGTAYAELIIHDQENLKSILANLCFASMQGRRIRFIHSSYDELCNDLFSSWAGEFKEGVAIPYSSVPKNEDIAMIGEQQRSSQFFIGQKDLQHLLNVCRNYKVSIII
ncbi:MAG: hypothetical protein EXX96DRAFT_488539 [Benjaminiella poitrasii]|nr:MAG: hypothetical protein EXX96DRAFT_488539 [Benjaminiella poitrasii]